MTVGKNNIATARKRDIDSGWAWVVFAAVLIARLIVSTVSSMTGVFYIVFLNIFPNDHLKISFIGALQNGLMGFLGPAVSILVDRTSCRFSTILGALLTVTAFVCGTFINSLDGFIIMLGFIMGTAGSILFVPLTVALRYYFDQRRDIVAGISEAVVGPALFIGTPLALLLLDCYGMKGTFLIIASIEAQICICGVIFLPSVTELEIKKRKTEDFYQANCKQDNQTKVKASKTASFITEMFHNIRISFMSLLKNWTYLLFLGSILTYFFGMSVCLNHLPNYAVTKNIGSENISIVMEVYAVGLTFGRVIISFFVGKLNGDPILCSSVLTGIAAASNFAMPFYNDWTESVYIYAALAGFFNGGPVALITAISVRVVGLKHVSNAFGLEMFFQGIGWIAGPPLAGWLFEIGGSFDYIFILLGVVLLVGCVLGALTFIFHHKNAGHREPLSSMTAVTTAADVATTKTTETTTVFMTVSSANA